MRVATSFSHHPPCLSWANSREVSISSGKQKQKREKCKQSKMGGTVLENFGGDCKWHDTNKLMKNFQNTTIHQSPCCPSVTVSRKFSVSEKNKAWVPWQGSSCVSDKARKLLWQGVIMIMTNVRYNAHCSLIKTRRPHRHRRRWEQNVRARASSLPSSSPSSKGWHSSWERWAETRGPGSEQASWERWLERQEQQQQQ